MVGVDVGGVGPLAGVSTRGRLGVDRGSLVTDVGHETSVVGGLVLDQLDAAVGKVDPNRLPEKKINSLMWGKTRTSRTAATQRNISLCKVRKTRSSTFSL